MSKPSLHVPGLVGDVMEWTLSTAPYPNETLAFCGAMSLLAALSGRKVRDRGDLRTNLYLIALAGSGSGKDWPRKVNTRILCDAGLQDMLGDSFASGEGLQDALFQQPTMLFQVDEIDSLLRTASADKSGRYEAITAALLKLYSSAGSLFPMRRKAGDEGGKFIEQPHMVLFGTATPLGFYRGLHERMTHNGLLARCLILDAGTRGKGHDPGSISTVPESILDAVYSWKHDVDQGGNLGGACKPSPRIIQATDDAQQILSDAREEADELYSKCEASGDAAGMAIYARVHEYQRKLAMLHAISRDKDAQIDGDAAVWACELVLHHAGEMLAKATDEAGVSPRLLEQEALFAKIVSRVRRDENSVPHSVLLKFSRLSCKDFMSAIQTLQQRGELEVDEIRTRGRAGLAYRIPGAKLLSHKVPA